MVKRKRNKDGTFRKTQTTRIVKAKIMTRKVKTLTVDEVKDLPIAERRQIAKQIWGV